MDVNIKLNKYIDNRMKNIRLSENTFKKYKKNYIDILLSKSELTDTEVKKHKQIMENRKNILNKTSGTDTTIKKNNEYIDFKDKQLSSLSKINDNNNNQNIYIKEKLLSNSSITHTIVKAQRKEKDEKKKELQEIVSSTNLNIRNQLSDFELCSQLNKLSETTGGTIKTIKSNISNKSIKLNKPKNYNYFDIKLYIKNKKIDKKKMEILYKRLKKRQDKIKKKLIEKKIIKGDIDNIPYKMLFQLYINDLKDDLEIKMY